MFEKRKRNGLFTWCRTTQVHSQSKKKKSPRENLNAAKENGARNVQRRAVFLRNGNKTDCKVNICSGRPLQSVLRGFQSCIRGRVDVGSGEHRGTNPIWTESHESFSSQGLAIRRKRNKIDRKWNGEAVGEMSSYAFMGCQVDFNHLASICQSKLLQHSHP